MNVINQVLKPMEQQLAGKDPVAAEEPTVVQPNSDPTEAQQTEPQQTEPEPIEVPNPNPTPGGGGDEEAAGDEAQMQAYYNSDPHQYDPFSQSRSLDIVRYCLQNLNDRLSELERSSAPAS